MWVVAAFPRLENSHEMPDRGRHIAVNIGRQRLLDASREVVVAREAPQRV
jgi:hypothetical protein